MRVWTRAGSVGLIAMAAALAFAATGTPGANRTERKPVTHSVRIEGMLFKPEVLEIAPGDSVTWTNNDILMHAVKSTEPNDEWQSKDIAAHAQWTRRFEADAHYICPYHPTMKGKIVVKAPGAPKR